MKPKISQRLPVRVAGWLRDTWLIVGVVVLLLGALELAYRAQGAIRHRIAGSSTRAEVFDAKPAWMEAYLEEQDRTYTLRWKAYVYFRRVPFQGAFINVDSVGHRVTPQQRPAAAARDLYFFGGSTMFGTLQRDSATIPAAVARALRERGVDDVASTNFGETGYVMTQEVLELILQLRAGMRPAVVVFYDGINDVFSAVQNGAPGLPQNEINRARDFQLGTRAFKTDYDLGAEARAAAALGQAAAGRIQLVERLRRFVVPRSSATALTAGVLSEQITASYVATARIVEALARAYGFRALLVWQPTLHGTDKPLSPGETSLMRGIEADAAQTLVRDIHRRIPRMLDSAMKAVPGVAFVDLSGLFTRDSAQVFADEIGHTLERANPPIADALAPALLQLLRR